MDGISRASRLMMDGAELTVSAARLLLTDRQLVRSILYLLVPVFSPCSTNGGEEECI
jgi:hypothetical protein